MKARDLKNKGTTFYNVNKQFQNIDKLFSFLSFFTLKWHVSCWGLEVIENM